MIFISRLGLVSQRSKKYRTQYSGRLRYLGPKKTDINLRIDADKRKDLISSRTVLKYNFLKLL